MNARIAFFNLRDLISCTRLACTDSITSTCSHENNFLEYIINFSHKKSMQIILKLYYSTLFYASYK